MVMASEHTTTMTVASAVLQLASMGSTTAREWFSKMPQPFVPESKEKYIERVLSKDGMKEFLQKLL
jgi:hypothetical protein